MARLYIRIPPSFPPNTVRANEAKGKGEVYVNRKNQQEGKKRRVEEALAGQPEDLLKDVFR